MKHFTEDEKYTVNTIILISTVEGFLMGIVNIFSKDEYKTSISIGLFILMLALLLIFKDKFFSFLIKRLSPSKSKRKIYAGKWLLDISFKNDDNKKRGRSGTCQIEHSLLGVKIQGDKLLDKKGQKITKKDFWISDSAEIIKQNNNEIIIYMYKIPSDSTQKDNYEEMNFDKVGLVVAKKIVDEASGEVQFKGTFRDIPLDDAQLVREGIVVLTPIEVK